MKYSDILKYILEIPMFQNIGQSAYNPSLDKISHLCDFLGNPQNSFKTIHIAGTNGKGSCSNMICDILQQHGLKVGLYTSPHLIDYRERIIVNSEMISTNCVEKFMSVAFKKIDKVKPSFFEFTTVLAFWAFREKNVDIAIIETGLGGRIDSTNIISPLISLITNISIDHKDILGDTVEAIAYQKAGIIKHYVPVVISEANNNSRAVFEREATEQKADIFFAQDRLKLLNKGYSNGIQFIEIEDIEKSTKQKYELLMLGEYQSKNLLGVLTVIDILNKYYGYNIHASTIKKAVKNCTIIGRWQVMSQKPFIVCDVGHNYDGIKEVVNMINLSSYDSIYIILGFMQDKDIDKILTLLPKEAKYIATQAKNPRAMNCDNLCSLLQKNGFDAKSVSKVSEAIDYAKTISNDNDMIFIGGSSFIVADYLK